MMIASIVLLVGGGLSLLYGFMQNGSLEAQIMSAFGSGKLNPGTPFMVIGGIALVVGIILLVVANQKKKAVQPVLYAPTAPQTDLPPVSQEDPQQ